MSIKNIPTILLVTAIFAVIFSLNSYAQDKPLPESKPISPEKTSTAPNLKNQEPITPTEICLTDNIENGLMPCKKGQIIEENNLISAFYQVAPEYGKAFLDLLNKWKSKEGTVSYADKFQLLTITDHQENIAVMEEVMKISDISAPQVMIEAQILERVIKSDLQLGWDATFSKPTQSKTFFRSIEQRFYPGAYTQALTAVLPPDVPKGTFLQGSTFSFFTTGSRGTTDIKFRTMVERNEATILSSPRVTVSSGSKATISSGQEVPFPQVTIVNNVATANVQYKSAEIRLEVTPTVIGSNFVKMIIVPEVKTVTSYQLLQGSETPVFASRRSDTTITIKSGETFHIGGLAREEDVLYERGIPLLCDIPLLGNLFKRHQRDKNKTEIIFIIKPTIIKKSEETIKPSIMDKK